MAAPVPVLLLARELGIGGSERQLAVTALTLDRSQFIPHVGCFREGFRAEELRSAGVPVVRFPVSSFRNASAVRGARAMGAYIRTHGIALVQSFDAPLNVFAVPVARFYGTPVVLSSQRAHRSLAGGYRRLLRLTDRMVDGIVVNCDFVRNHLVRDEGVRPERIHLCYNGLDTTLFHAQARRRNEANLTVGVVCALRPEKGLPTLLQAFARVCETKPDAGLRLLTVGSGPMLPELERLAAQLGITKRTQFVPTTAAVAERLGEIDIFVLPSLTEAFSNALMEAMACGCAGVASRVGGNPELITHGETGLLFAAGDADDLARQLTRLIDDRDFRHKIANAGSTFVSSRFSLPVFAHTMTGIYAAALNAVR